MKSHQILSLFAGLALLIATVAAGFYWLAYKGPVNSVESTARLGGRIVDRLAEITQFRPRLVIGEKTVIESSQQIAELAVAQKSYSQTYRWEHSFAGSTKRMEIKGDFVAKAGYALKSPTELRFSEDGAKLTMVLPQASVLSNEMTRYEILKDEDGFWNKLSTDDRERAANALKHSADQFLRQSGILNEADDSMMGHLRDALTGATTNPVEIIRENPELP